MNNSMTFEEQTEQIVEALFTTLYVKKKKKGKVTHQHPELCCGVVEVQAEGGSASNFDPVSIAKFLKSIGDQYNAIIEDPVKAVIAEERKKIKKFREEVESLRRHWISHVPGLQPERAFLAVAVKLFEELINKTHGDNTMINILTETINGNPEVRSYIERQGGWGNLGRSLNSP